MKRLFTAHHFAKFEIKYNVIEYHHKTHNLKLYSIEIQFFIPFQELKKVQMYIPLRKASSTFVTSCLRRDSIKTVKVTSQKLKNVVSTR